MVAVLYRQLSASSLETKAECMSADYSHLIEEVAARQKLVQSYLFSEENRLDLKLPHLQDAVSSYLRAGGKSLRPAVLMFACGAVGGDENSALPAAAAIELYHTFTLVHDDIIDRDDMRRSVMTVHREFATRGQQELNYDVATAEHYGLSVAILAGDLQQGWAASLLPDLHRTYDVPADLVLNLTFELFNRTQTALINGETIDILQAETPVDDLHEDDVLDMLWQKTGILYEFAGRAGAAIGLNQPDLGHSMVDSVAKFAGKVGVAFQLQDDVLGLVGDSNRTGKSAASDILEGKRTIIVLHSLKQMPERDRQFVFRSLGNRQAGDDDIDRVRRMLVDAGGVEYAKNLAQQYVQDAKSHLDILDNTPQKRLLLDWANYVLVRDL